jgi:flagellar protein FliO/FliZ
VLELVIRVVVSLGVVLGLFWAVTRLGARKLGGRDRALVRVRSRQALSRGSSLAVVEVGSRVLVVGVSDAGVRLLTELDPFELETDASDLTELPAAGLADELPVAASTAAPAGAATSARNAGRHAASRHAGTASSSALGGSLLAPTTWRQAWAAATGRPAAETGAGLTGSAVIGRDA